MTNSLAVCIYCKHNSDEVPLLRLKYKDAEVWICPQHLPILIHKPTELVGILPGAEHLTAFSEEE